MPEHSEIAVVASDLCKVYGNRQALRDVSFELPAGSFLSVFGPNGAGKSTLLRLLGTLARPTSGHMQILGLDSKEQADQIRQRIGVISHRSMLHLDLTAEQNLMFYARLYGVLSPEARVTELLQLVELTSRRHDSVRAFSRGMTQRMAIARALINDPELLFLDEPYSGLDPRAAAILDELLGAIRPNRSFIMVSHDLHQGYGLATHLMVLSQGRTALFANRDDYSAEQFVQLYNEVTG